MIQTKVIVDYFGTYKKGDIIPMHPTTAEACAKKGKVSYDGAPTSKMNAKERSEHILTLQTVEEIQAFIDGEKTDSVLKVANERIVELSKVD